MAWCLAIHILLWKEQLCYHWEFCNRSVIWKYFIVFVNGPIVDFAHAQVRQFELTFVVLFLLFLLILYSFLYYLRIGELDFYNNFLWYMFNNRQGEVYWENFIVVLSETTVRVQKTSRGRKSKKQKWLTTNLQDFAHCELLL